MVVAVVKRGGLLTGVGGCGRGRARGGGLLTGVGALLTGVGIYYISLSLSLYIYIYIYICQSVLRAKGDSGSPLRLGPNTPFAERERK